MKITLQAILMTLNQCGISFRLENLLSHKVKSDIDTFRIQDNDGGDYLYYNATHMCILGDSSGSLITDDWRQLLIDQCGLEDTDDRTEIISHGTESCLS